MKASLQYRVHQDLKAAIELRAKRQRADPGDLVRATLTKEFLPELNEMDVVANIQAHAQFSNMAMMEAA